MCLGVTAVSMVFGAVAAVTAQLWRQARAATGTAMGVLALAALVRGVGDVIDNSGSALSWFSPIAWAQQMRPFVDLRWWPFALLVLLAVALIASAALLESRRQYDDGVIPSAGEHPNARPISERVRPAPDAAARSDDRLGRRIVLVGPGIRVDDEVAAWMRRRSNELLQRVLAQQGTDGVYTTLTQFLAAAATAYVVSAVLRRVQRRAVRSRRGRAGGGGIAVAVAPHRGRSRHRRVGGADVLRRPRQRLSARASRSASRRPSGG